MFRSFNTPSSINSCRINIFSSTLPRATFILHLNPLKLNFNFNGVEIKKAFLSVDNVKKLKGLVNTPSNDQQ